MEADIGADTRDMDILDILEILDAPAMAADAVTMVEADAAITVVLVAAAVLVDDVKSI